MQPNTSISKVSFNDLKHVHIIGVCGTLMGSFAAFLKRKGVRVTGSDQNVYPPMSDVLSQAGVELFSGYSEDNFKKIGKPDLVVIGNVIGPNNVEAKVAMSSGVPYSSLPEAMEKLLLTKTRNLVVAGTHGKTTTSSLLAHTLVHAGRPTNYFIGGVSQDLPTSFEVNALTEGAPFVLEGDEYDTAFWDKVPKFFHYLPDDTILTSVEYDHADIYPDFDAVKRAFVGLIERIRPGGRLVACVDYAVIGELAKKSKVPVVTYGSERSGAEVYPVAIATDSGGVKFSIFDRGEKVGPFELSLPGVHNALNATAVYILAQGQGLTASQIQAGFKAFRGVKRRQEERGTIRGITVIDDFAHHPTAVKETLKALKSKYAPRKLITVFEPRSATSRRKVFQREYGEAFLEADQIFIAVPYDQTKIQSDDQFSSDQLVADLVGSGKHAELLADDRPDEWAGVKQVAKAAQATANLSPVIAVLSNGGFNGFIPKLLKQLSS